MSGYSDNYTNIVLRLYDGSKKEEIKNILLTDAIAVLNYPHSQEDELALYKLHTGIDLTPLFLKLKEVKTVEELKIIDREYPSSDIEECWQLLDEETRSRLDLIVDNLFNDYYSTVGCFEETELKNVASFKIVTLQSGKFRLEFERNIKCPYTGETYGQYWWHRNTFDSTSSAVTAVAPLIAVVRDRLSDEIVFEEDYCGEYAYLLAEFGEEEGNILHNGWLILTEEYPSLVLDGKTNRVYSLTELGLINDYAEDLDSILSVIDNIEAERDRCFVPGQLSLF